MYKVDKRSCPICLKYNGKKIIKSEIDLNKNLYEIDKYWRGFYKTRVFFDYYRCNLCQLLYCKEYLDDTSLKNLYSSMGDNIHSGSIDSDLKTKKEYLSYISKKINLDKCNNILEIGADNGTFIKLINKKYSHLSIDCVEPNITMHTKLSKYGDNVYQSISEIPKGKKYDLVILIHVVDHIPNVREFIYSFDEYLEKDSFLYVVVHNEKSILTKLLGKKWPAYCMQHPHIFNPVTIRKLFEDSGYKLFSFINTVNIFSIGYLIHHFLLLFKVNIKFPNLFNIKLKLGNIGLIFKK